MIFKHCAVSMFFFRLSRASAGWTQEQKNVKRKGYLFPREEMFIDSSPNAIFCLLRFFPRQRWPLATKNLSIMATLKNKIQFGFNFIISWQIHLCFGESSDKTEILGKMWEHNKNDALLNICNFRFIMLLQTHITVFKNPS